MEKKLGHYTIVKLLGTGGMGQVFEATHDQMKRRAAIKVLHKKFAHNRQIAARFLNEARATSMVQHPSLVQIYEYGQTEDGTAYLAPGVPMRKQEGYQANGGYNDNRTPRPRYAKPANSSLSRDANAPAAGKVKVKTKAK